MIRGYTEESRIEKTEYLGEKALVLVGIKDKRIRELKNEIGRLKINEKTLEKITERQEKEIKELEDQQNTSQCM